MSGFVISRRSVLVGAGAAVGALALPSHGPVLGAPRPTGAGVARMPAGGADQQLLHDWIEQIYASQRDARALPPAAARVYGLTMLAAYEATVDGVPGGRSLGGQLIDLPRRRPHAGGAAIDWAVAANAAITAVAVAANDDRSDSIRAALLAFGTDRHERLVAGLRPALVERSTAHGDRIGAWLTAWCRTDGYAETRALEYVPPVGPGLWQATAPNFGTAIEPHWHLVRPFALPITRGADGYAIDEARPSPHLPFDTTVGSPFWQQANTVYEVSKNVTDAQRETALYWRDNPDGVTGLPSGHWLQIAASVVADMGLGLADAARVLALTAIATADGFTSCWIEKYRSNLLRPITYIRAHIDPSWSSIVNSPAFPEYTSGHSVGSGAAAEALALLVGERRFTDHAAGSRTVEGVTLRPRTFASFTAAADEAAISRLYGGIHYPMGIQNGVPQGREVARRVIGSLRTGTFG